MLVGMSNLTPRNTGPVSLAMRETLFGDMPMDLWPQGYNPAVATVEPWASFIKAREAIAGKRVEEAITHWLKIADTPGLEPRHHLQAWHFLREYGKQPPADRAKQLLGVVLEVPVENGLDLLAAYADRHARYCNYTGAGVVWEHPNNSLDQAIDALLTSGQQILNAIGPWNKPRPGPPPAGQVRISLLAPSGLHFGQASFETLSADPLARPAIGAALTLLKALTEAPQHMKKS